MRLIKYNNHSQITNFMAIFIFASVVEPHYAKASRGKAGRPISQNLSENFTFKDLKNIQQYT